jgi:hypothetical protein
MHNPMFDKLRAAAKGEMADQPQPNRAQRRAQEQHDRRNQRRGQKAYDRAQREAAREAQMAQRALLAQGVGFTAYWNGLPTFAMHGTAVVESTGGFWAGTDTTGTVPGVEHGPDPTGQRIKVVAVALNGVNFGGGTIYLYDEDGSGTRKVTEGRGAPQWPHQEVVIDDQTFEGEA